MSPIILLGAVLVGAGGCSKENTKRLGYETLHNIGQQQCMKDYSTPCPERESYDEYQRKREEARSQ